LELRYAVIFIDAWTANSSAVLFPLGGQLFFFLLLVYIASRRFLLLGIARARFFCRAALSCDTIGASLADSFSSLGSFLPTAVIFLRVYVACRFSGKCMLLGGIFFFLEK